MTKNDTDFRKLFSIHAYEKLSEKRCQDLSFVRKTYSLPKTNVFGAVLFATKGFKCVVEVPEPDGVFSRLLTPIPVTIPNRLNGAVLKRADFALIRDEIFQGIGILSPARTSIDHRLGLRSKAVFVPLTCTGNGPRQDA